MRVRVTSTDDAPVFLGMARAADVERYLAGIEHDVVTEVRSDDAAYARRTGTGTVEEVVEPSADRWTAVVMSADAAPGVSVEADVGAEAPVRTWVAGALLLGGVLLGTGAVALLALGARSLSRAAPSPAAGE